MLAKTGLRSSGGFSTLLAELAASGFVTFLPQFGNKKKSGKYLLTDEFTLFLSEVGPRVGEPTVLRPVSGPEDSKSYFAVAHSQPANASNNGFLGVLTERLHKFRRRRIGVFDLSFSLFFGPGGSQRVYA